jgi:hypothetical protein
VDALRGALSPAEPQGLGWGATMAVAVAALVVAVWPRASVPPPGGFPAGEVGEVAVSDVQFEGSFAIQPGEGITVAVLLDE